MMAARRARTLLNQIVHRTTSDPREEPGALAAHAGICAGGEEKSSSLPRPSPAFGIGAELKKQATPETWTLDSHNLFRNYRPAGHPQRNRWFRRRGRRGIQA